jgi:Protein of unknown function (DUF551)
MGDGAMSGWMPINTAPSDGMVILGAWHVFLNGDVKWLTTQDFAYVTKFFGLIRTKTNAAKWFTHWKPMPQEPQNAKGIDMKWQPINTAPSDEQEAILVFDGSGFHVAWIGWNEDETPVYFNGNRRVDATHWMPLPEPPKCFDP